MTDNRMQDMFPPNLIDLQVEVRNHPELIERLQRHRAEDFEIRMAEIATYCEVILDGEYVQADFDHLAGILVKKLVEKRTPLIFPK